VSELIHGKRELTVDTARRLEAALGISADFWMRREAAYRLRRAEEVEDLATFEGIRERARHLSVFV
jgi:plasmid maintenance system antidote protein VapI